MAAGGPGLQAAWSALRSLLHGAAWDDRERVYCLTREEWDEIDHYVVEVDNGLAARDATLAERERDVALSRHHEAVLVNQRYGKELETTRTALASAEARALAAEGERDEASEAHHYWAEACEAARTALSTALAERDEAQRVAGVAQQANRELLGAIEAERAEHQAARGRLERAERHCTHYIGSGRSSGVFPNCDICGGDGPDEDADANGLPTHKDDCPFAALAAQPRSEPKEPKP